MSFDLLTRLVRTASFGLAVLYVLLFVTSVSILGVVFYLTVETSLDRQIATRIDAEMALLQQELSLDGKDALVAEVQERTNVFPALEYLVLDANGNRLAGDLPSMPDTVGWTDLSEPRGRRGDPPRTLRVRNVALPQGLRLAVGDDLAPIENVRAALIEALGWLLLAVPLLSLAGGLALSFGFLRRVDAITRTADAIIEGDLDQRIPTRGTNDNFDRLSETLNLMLDRIQALMDSLRQVSNDIAHSLKTPLGHLRQKLRSARASDGLKCKRAIDAAMADTENLLETFSALLRIAQIEAGTRRSGFGQVEMSRLLANLADTYTAAAEHDGKSITVNVPAKITAWGDRALLTEMFSNLLDNALRHTPRGTNIEVSVAENESGAVAFVADDGPGVPAADRDLIFRRFYRSARSTTTPGHGLGLALAAAVADLHGMTLTAEDNAPGLRMRISLRA
ncbi:ATP-binding protein [Methyloceanibacter sp.]|uniref:sensor histidine kinase n=1 Tax=Methyloceanibacter sp. TaxID=1965321 RepID=UPI003D6C790A